MSLDQQKIGEIVSQRSGADAVFSAHNIEYWRMGNTSLNKVASRLAFDTGQLVEELSELPYAGHSIPTETRPLIAYLTKRYHDGHRTDLHNALDLANALQMAYLCDQTWPHDVVIHLKALIASLEAHGAHESGDLYPLMLSGLTTSLRFHVHRMMMEHDDIADGLDSLARVTQDYILPDTACATWHRLYDVCQKLDRDLRFHMHIENNLLFPRFLVERFSA